MYFFVTGAKRSGKTTVAEALRDVLSEQKRKEKFGHDFTWYYHFPTKPPPASINEERQHLHFLNDFEKIGNQMHESMGDDQDKAFVYDRCFISTCVHQGLLGGQPELIPDIVRNGFRSLTDHTKSQPLSEAMSLGKETVCFILVEATNGGFDGGDEGKWRPSESGRWQLVRAYQRMFEYLKVQLQVDDKAARDNLRTVFIRVKNKPVESEFEDGIEGDMRSEIRNRFFDNLITRDQQDDGTHDIIGTSLNTIPINN